MQKATALDFWEIAPQALQALATGGGVFCTVADRRGARNVLTVSWGLIGPRYHEYPILVIAVAPMRYSWRFLEEVPEFVIGLPVKAQREALVLCGTKSGRDMDKFAAAGLTPVRSVHVKAPSIAECAANIECRIYTKIPAPHEILTPEHRRAPVGQQHTIYFAQVLGTYRGGLPRRKA